MTNHRLQGLHFSIVILLFLTFPVGWKATREKDWKWSCLVTNSERWFFVNCSSLVVRKTFTVRHWSAVVCCNFVWSHAKISASAWNSKSKKNVKNIPTFVCKAKWSLRVRRITMHFCKQFDVEFIRQVLWPIAHCYAVSRFVHVFWF